MQDFDRLLNEALVEGGLRPSRYWDVPPVPKSLTNQNRRVFDVVAPILSSAMKQIEAIDRSEFDDKDQQTLNDVDHKLSDIIGGLEIMRELEYEDAHPEEVR